MTSETRPVRRGRMSPAMRAFLAVDVVLVLMFVFFLIGTRSGGETSDTPAAPPAASPTSASEPAGTSEDAEASGTETESPDDDTSDAPDDADDGPDEAQLFASPSGNIVCSISPDAASCSIAELSDEGLIDDDSCDGTVGHVVRVTEEEAERPCVTGRPPGKAPNATPELDYEDSTSAFGYTCTSSRSGIICRHDSTGHGFSIARAGSSLF